jgi:hypothetical protein
MFAARFSIPGCQLTSCIFCAILPPTQKNLISIECKCCCLIELFSIPTKVILLQCTGVFGCGCPISFSVSLKIMPIWHLWYNAPSPASQEQQSHQPCNHTNSHEQQTSPIYTRGTKTGTYVTHAGLTWRTDTHQ